MNYYNTQFNNNQIKKPKNMKLIYVGAGTIGVCILLVVMYFMFSGGSEDDAGGSEDDASGSEDAASGSEDDAGGGGEEANKTVDCELEWKSWSPCTVSTGCDTDQYNEFRAATVKVEPQNGGLECGSLTEYRAVPQDCKVQWSEWGPCSASDICPRRMGTSIRKGTIVRKERFGGSACPDKLTEYSYDDSAFPRESTTEASEETPEQYIETHFKKHFNDSLPATALTDFVDSGNMFQLGVFKNGTLKCVRIDMGRDDKFAHKDNIHIQECDVNDQPQLWTYDVSKKYIKTVKPSKNNRKLCLDYDNKKFKVTICDQKPQKNRQFTIIPASTWQTDDNGNPLWRRGDSKNNMLMNTAIPVRIFTHSARSSNKCMGGRTGLTNTSSTGSCFSSETQLYLIPYDPIMNTASSVQLPDEAPAAPTTTTPAAQSTSQNASYILRPGNVICPANKEIETEAECHQANEYLQQTEDDYNFTEYGDMGNPTRFFPKCSNNSGRVYWNSYANPDENKLPGYDAICKI